MKDRACLIILISLFIASCVFIPIPTTERPVKEYPHYAEELLHLINQYRTSNGLNVLYYDNSLTAIAEGHSTYMYHRNVLSHDHFRERFDQSVSDHCVENVGWNYPTPRDQFNTWRKSEEHNRNMLVGDIRKAGISRVGAYVTFFACN